MQAHQKLEHLLVFNNGSVEFLILGAFPVMFLGQINFLPVPGEGRKIISGGGVFLA